jgi:hypothetical protein
MVCHVAQWLAAPLKLCNDDDDDDDDDVAHLAVVELAHVVGARCKSLDCGTPIQLANSLQCSQLQRLVIRFLLLA